MNPLGNLGNQYEHFLIFLGNKLQIAESYITCRTRICFNSFRKIELYLVFHCDVWIFLPCFLAIVNIWDNFYAECVTHEYLFNFCQFFDLYSFIVINFMLHINIPCLNKFCAIATNSYILSYAIHEQLLKTYLEKEMIKWPIKYWFHFNSKLHNFRILIKTCSMYFLFLTT